MDDPSEPLSSHAKREFKREQKEQEHQEAEKQKPSHLRQHAVKYAIIAIVVLGIGGWVVSAITSPGKWDDFAKCLTEKGVVVYGAMEWCKYTQEQAAMFGKSFKLLNYHDYSERNDIKITPTWFINGEKYERVQSFQKLAELTGCEY